MLGCNNVVRIHKDWPYVGIEYESTLSQDNLNLLSRLGHRLDLSDTIGSTQSIQIIDELLWFRRS